MGYLTGFNHDIFVSYARGPHDFPTLTGKTGNLVQNWTFTLVDDLRALLNVELREKEPEDMLDIWIDPRLSSNVPLTKELELQVSECAIFLCVLSDYYLDSAFCLDELNYFLQRNPNALADGRVFVARMRPSEWPDALVTQNGDHPTGVKFHIDAAVGEPIQTFGWPLPDLGKDETYRKAVVNLQRDLERVLRKLKSLEHCGDEGRSVVDLPASVGRTVVLGYASRTEDAYKEEVRTQFKKLGIKVVPALTAQDPVDERELRSLLDNELPNCDSLVILAGKSCEKWPREQVAGHVGLQLEAAKERNIPVYIWVRVDDLSNVDQEDYREVLADLEDVAAGSNGRVRVRFASVDDFVSYCAGLLDEPIPPRGVEQFAFIHFNNPKEDDPEYEVFRETVLDAIADGRRAITRPRDAHGQIRLQELSEDLRNAEVCALLCFDDEISWAVRRASQIASVFRCDSLQRPRLLIMGPKSSGERVVDMRAWKFQTIFGTPFDQTRLREDIKRAIDGP